VQRIIMCYAAVEIASSTELFSKKTLKVVKKQNQINAEDLV